MGGRRFFFLSLLTRLRCRDLLHLACSRGRSGGAGRRGAGAGRHLRRRGRRRLAVVELREHLRAGLETGADHLARIVFDAGDGKSGFPLARTKAAFQQRRRARRARVAARLAEDHRNELAAVARGAGDEIVAGGAGVAGLDAVAAGERCQQRIVRADGDLVDRRLRLRVERRFFREVAQQRLRQQTHVARGRHLLLGRQSVRIDEMRVRHAEAGRRLVHLLDERGFIAAQRLGDGDGDVVGGAHDERLQRLAEGYVLADLEAEARRRLFVGGGRDEDLRVLRRPLVADGGEHDVGRHHLGERGGIPRGIEVFGVEDVPFLEVEHHGGAGRSRLHAEGPGRQRCCQSDTSVLCQDAALLR